MTVDFQASLFDAGPDSADPSGSAFRPIGTPSPGTGSAQVPGWTSAPAGSAAPIHLLTRLVHDVPWQAERRQMYDRVVDVPRLTRLYGEGAALPDPLLAEAREALSGHYAAELREPFTTAGLCYYRDGRDSVAWHGDTHGRSSREDTMVAILSLGDARRLSLRPRAGGSSLSLPSRATATCW